MRRLWVCLLMVALVLCIGISDLYADNTYTVIVNGKQVDCNGYIQVVKGRLVVPLRSISEALEATVNWDQANKRVVITSKEDTSLKLMKVNGEQTTWPYWYENGRLYMEYRNALELIRMTHPAPHYVIAYNKGSSTVVINNLDLEVPYLTRDGFRVISVDFLKNKTIVNYEWDAESGNLTLVSF
ncbi:MAG: stalk domain-containing protein [Ignavibacteriales bacterium]